MVFMVGIGNAWGTDLEIPLTNLSKFPLDYGLVTITNTENTTISNPNLTVKKATAKFKVETISGFYIKSISFTDANPTKNGGFTCDENASYMAGPTENVYTYTAPNATTSEANFTLIGSGGTAQIGTIIVTVSTNNQVERLSAFGSISDNKIPFTSSATTTCIELSIPASNGVSISSNRIAIPTSTKHLIISTKNGETIKYIAIPKYQQSTNAISGSSDPSGTYSSDGWTPSSSDVESVDLSLTASGGTTYSQEIFVVFTSAGGGEEKDYTVTAATSTGANTYGTVAASASSLDENETTTITASPATGYRVTNWAVSGTGASISPSGESNATSTTLTMGTENATVTVTFGPKSYTVTLDNQSATTEGTESVTTTYNASTNLTSAITCPTKTGKVFAGYFTAANGGGVQLIDAAGNWIASAGGGSTYLDGSKNWKKDADVTLYACWMEYATSLDFYTYVQSAEANIEVGKTSTTYTILSDHKFLYSLQSSSALDNSEDGRYKGLKFKHANDYVLFLVKANSSLSVKWGYVKTTKPKYSINGGAETEFSSITKQSDNQSVDMGTETYDRLVKIKAMDGDAAVLKEVTITAPTPACAAPTSVTVAATEAEGNYGWRYSKGETIDLTCSYTGGTGTPSYQWQKYVENDWEDISTATNASAGTARLQIANCTSGDGGSYRCVVSMGSDCDLASTGYFLRVFTLNGNYDGEENWLENAITWTGQYTGTVTLNLNASRLYKFKVTDNNGKWFGYSENNIILSAINWNCGTGNHDCRLFTGPTGNYVATINIEHANDGSPYVNVQLAYPEVTHPAAGYAYFKKWDDWNNNYYIHWWHYDGENTYTLTDWSHNPKIETAVTICENDYIYFPVLGYYEGLIVKDSQGDASHSSGSLSSEGSSGKYFDFTNNNAWNDFSTYTISFAGNGGTGEMSAISAICPNTDRALTANAFEKTGSNFIGWVADVDVKVGDATISAGEIIANEATLKEIHSDIALTAQWDAIGYIITHNAATNGTYTIKVGDAEEVSTNTTANYGQTVTLAATPNTGCGFTGWTVMNGETPVAVSNNQFTMPAGNVTISAAFVVEPNVYYYKSASHYDGSAYKNPEGNDAGSNDNTALSTPWTICNACVTGVTKVEATAARYDGKGDHMNAYIKLRQKDNGKIVFTIDDDYKATIKIKMGGYDGANTSITMKLNDSGDNISYSGTMTGAGTTENAYAELTYANLAAGAYTLKPTSGSLYISQIDIQTTPVYTLIYDANGGTGTMGNTVGTGTVTLRTNTYTKSGCTFQGWATSQDNANAGTLAYADGATDYNLSANATLYAVWKLNAPTISCAANVVTMSAMSGAAIYYTTDGETTPTSSSTLYNSSSKPQIAANTTFKAIAILENYVSSDVTTQTCEYVAPATVDDLVTIDADYTFTPSAAMTANTLYESDKIIAIGDGNSYSSGLQIKENRAIAFKVADNAKVKVTFNEKSDDSTPRKMQLGTATSGDAKTAYGMSGSSPVVFDVITTGGVVYLTASKDLYMTKLEILYPHTVTYALGDGTGTLPTESAHYNGEQFYVHDGVTNITAPENKEFSVWSDGTSTYAGGAQYTMGSSNVTLTAQWITALPLPTITFNNGSYTIAGDALNLSSLFTSNSDGAVTYTVKTAGETGASIAGTSFTATAAGSAVVTASQAATASYKAKSVDATITISAPTEPDGIKMVEDNALTGNFRTSQSLSNGSYTVGGIAYTKYLAFGSTASSWGSVAGLSNKYMAYSVTSTNTKFYFYVHNNSTSAYKIEIYKITEGSSSVTKDEVEVAASANVVKEYTLETTTNTEVYIGVTNTNIQFCQVIAQEIGTVHKTAPAVGYEMNLNKGRLSTASNTATTLEGLTFVLNSGYSIANNTEAKIKTCGTDYISFTIPSGQTRQLQLTTSNTEKYVVSKTLGDAENQYQPKANNETKNWNLTAGTWYINPQGSNVNITNIAFDETPDPITVTFKDGASTLSEQALFAGDKVAAPSPAPTKSGYRFVEWQLSGSAYDFDDEVTEDITLDAVWQKTWTVTFDSDGGSDVAAATVDNGAAVAAPDPAPEKAGHSLVRWYKVTGEEGQEETAYNFSTAVTADMTLKALWHELQDDPSLSALSYDGHDIDLNSGVDNEGVLTFTYELPYNVNYTAGKLVPVPAAGTANLSEITYTAGTNTASFTVTAVDGPVVQNYAVVFTNAPKDMLCLVWADMTDDNTLTLDENKSALDIAVQATGGVRKESTPSEYQGYTGYKFNNEGSYAELKDGNFKSGDKVDVFVVATCGDKMRVYGTNEATDANVVAISENNMVQGHNLVTMTADAASLYLRRGVKNNETYNGWNPHIAYIAVYRAYPVPVIKSISFNGAAGVVGESTITATIPYTTNMASLPIEATFMSNDPDNTSGDVGGPWVEAGEGVYTNSYVVTDKDGDTKTYTVTLTRAAVSHDASLTALAVEGYSIDFAAATLSYNVELPYGSTIDDLPAVTYTVAAGATAVKVDADELPGTTTITVTAEDESTVQEYTIYFHANQTPTFAIFDGSSMDAIETSGSDDLSGFAWTIKDASKTSAESGAKLFDGKNYPKYVNLFTSATKAPNDGDTRYITITIPTGYLAKFRLVGCGNGDGSRSIFISKDISSTVDESIAYATTTSSNALDGRTSDYQFPGTYYLCCNNSIRLYELSVQLYPIDYSRDVTPKTYGTICLPNGGVMVGATIFEVAHMTYENAQPYKVFFDEVIDGVMEAGMPYIFLPKEGAEKIAVTYTDEANASAGKKNGLYGTMDYMNGTQLYGKYIFYNNSIFASENPQNWLNANRAYIVLSEVPDYVTAPAPGRRRVSMGVNGTNGATGFENIEASEGRVQKVLIDGKIYILRGEKVFDATGRMVK